MIIIGLTLHTLGTILIGLMALTVHDKVLHERHLDSDVFNLMVKEQYMGKIGIFLVLIGFVLQVIN